ncbi:tRNA 4-thiouridine(8) synthase ThiI [Candidatus Altiarchaeales archaeon WOR_SM1_SCG]|nr:tRNA 4-thiouridine(8) synthase ThiI [Candidatus Altiarchaeales archaeon WOR_SM1_SCG]
MNHNTVIVRYGEIFLKSDYVRKKFENKLIENLVLKLKNKNLSHKIIKKRHRLYIESDDERNIERIAQEVKDVFGIVSVSPAIKTGAEMEKIADIAVNFSKNLINSNNSFAVRTHRTGNHEFSSMDVDREIGAKILEETCSKVDLTNPDRVIFIEIQDDCAFIFDEKIKGTGGMPYGTQGRAVALISGGIDSPAAGFMMMRRGCELSVVHFGNEIDEIIKKLENYSVHKIKIYNIEREIFNEILGEISKVAGKYTCVVCKRMMLKFAGKIAEATNAKGIVMGDSLGQVASQTLDNLMVVNSAASYPVYRPLIGMDKEDIVQIAKKIGTYELQSKEGCTFTPKKPSTSADLRKIEEIENEIGIDELIEKFMKNFIHNLTPINPAIV